MTRGNGFLRLLKHSILLKGCGVYHCLSVTAGKMMVRTGEGAMKL